MHYTPIHDSILRSSVLLEDLPTRWLWTVMLILADQTRESQGIVDCPVDRLAQIANITVEEARHAIDRLSSPDEHSSSKEAEGRRIVACESVEGFETRRWRLVNWEKYQREIRKAQMAAASRKYRAKKILEKNPSGVIERHQASSDRHPLSPSLSPSPTQTKNQGTTVGRFAPPTIEQVREFITEKGQDVDPVKFCAFYESNGWKVGKNPMKKWKAACYTWDRKERE